MRNISYLRPESKPESGPDLHGAAQEDPAQPTAPDRPGADRDRQPFADSHSELAAGADVNADAGADSAAPGLAREVRAVDEFTSARIQRLWTDWLSERASQPSSKLRFHGEVIRHQPTLAHIRLATVYVVLARNDARLGGRFTLA